MSEKVIDIVVNQKTYNPTRNEKVIAVSEQKVTYNPTEDDSLPKILYRLVTQSNDFIIAENGDFIEWRDQFIGWVVTEKDEFILVGTNTFLEI